MSGRFRGREQVTTTGAFASSDQQVVPSHQLLKRQPNTLKSNGLYLRLCSHQQLLSADLKTPHFVSEQICCRCVPSRLLRLIPSSREVIHFISRPKWRRFTLWLITLSFNLFVSHTDRTCAPRLDKWQDNKGARQKRSEAAARTSWPTFLRARRDSQSMQLTFSQSVHRQICRDVSLLSQRQTGSVCMRYKRPTQRKWRSSSSQTHKKNLSWVSHRWGRLYVSREGKTKSVCEGKLCC